ncbi:DUF6385 domain-containing protein, partial [Clostridium aestuarii]
KVGTAGTITKLVTVGTITRVGTLTKVGTAGTITRVGTLTKVGTAGTLTKVVTVGTISNQVNVKINDRKFVEVSETVTEIPTGAGVYGTVIDTSKYEATTWYIDRLSSSVGQTVNVQLAVAPTHSAKYAIVGGAATVIGGTAQVITNDYYMHYTKVKCWTPSRTATVQIWFNGMY